MIDLLVISCTLREGNGESHYFKGRDFKSATQKPTGCEIAMRDGTVLCVTDAASDINDQFDAFKSAVFSAMSA